MYSAEYVPLRACQISMPSSPAPMIMCHTTRLEMVNRAVDAHFGGNLGRVRCLDVGCHEGYYSVAMARKGAREVRGIDVREENLRKARFVAETLGLSNVGAIGAGDVAVEADAEAEDHISHSEIIGQLYFSSGDSVRMTSASTWRAPAALGCMPSRCINSSCPPTPSRRKGINVTWYFAARVR